MAEPVIISYARGLLKEFPGVPEGTIDVIPVDLVVAAIIDAAAGPVPRSEEHTSELQSLMRISYAVFCLKNNTHTNPTTRQAHHYTHPHQGSHISPFDDQDN